MNEKQLYGIWGACYAACAILGFIPVQTGPWKALFLLLSLGFFLPGFLLLRKAIQEENTSIRRHLRIVCGCSLGLTLVMLIVNFLSVQASAAAGQVLYALLILVSVPMISSQYWVVSLFLWAFLLIGSFTRKKPANH